MRYRFLGQILATVLFLVTCLAKADPEITVEPTPAWVKTLTPVDSTQLPQGSVRYHLSNSQILHQGKDQQSYFQLKMEPLNQQGVGEISELTFGFYPAFQHLVVHDISIVRDGKRLNRLQKAAFKLFQTERELSSKLYSEQWSALYILEDIRPGDILTYAYTIQGSNPIFERSDFGRFYLSWPQSVDRRFVRIISDQKLNYRFNRRDHPVTVSRHQSNYVYELDLRDVPAVLAESEYPTWHDPLNYIQYSGYSNWEQVNTWARGLYAIDRTLPGSLRKQLDAWREESGLKEAVNKAIRYVQEDIRYFGIELGINSHQPRTPRATLEKRYGDCKDKALLLTSMLAHLGVHSSPALVSSSRGRDIGRDIPSPGSFDHVINLIQLNGREYWVDATAAGQGIQLRHKGFFNYEHALPVAPATRTLKRVEPSFAEKSLLSTEIEELFDIDPADNSAELRVNTTFSHLKAEQVRRFFLASDSEQIKNSYTNFIATYYPGVDPAPLISYSDNLEENRLKVSEHYQIQSFAKLSSARKIFSLYGSGIVQYISKPQRPIRRSPLALVHPVDIRQRAVANIRGELLWQEALGSTEIDNPWFTFSRTAELHEDSLSVEFVFQSKSDHVNQGDMSEYMAQFDKLDKALHYQFWAKGKASDQRNNSKEMKNLIKSLINK
ncbi:DUF3857 domain-containing transglutaminase family protein [Microbulbifer spongiae]|uniref:DUF3857 domain-containing transglutaminase family protein n=1 Tax=Microbulbifer spongiae TaxID=2944933 RepID=A0ABY9EDR6_9GAMM|nr:DUF3857 domain-containing transglutaminase family protein [Microbulbifer sp. MI-G]WKD50287.1 DUF3857 domain-containing transglutaminase family protein [Microbulbifer sp. MI-G]